MSRARGPHSPIVVNAEVWSTTAAPGGQVVGEPLEVRHAVQAAGDHAVAVVGQPHHGEVGAEAALGVEHRRVDHPAVGHVGLGDDDALHGLRRGRPDDVEDRERGQVDDAGPLAHREVLGVDDRRPPAGVPLVLARQDPVAVLAEQGLVGLVPERPLPADGLEELGARGALRRVHRREALAALAGPLLAGVHDAVGLVERLRRARPHVGAGALVRVEPGDVGVVHVDLGVAVGHPLGDGPPDARALLDPHRGRRPQALDLGRLPEQRRRRPGSARAGR